MDVVEKLPKPIDEYFKSLGNANNKKYNELFRGNEDFIDQMSETDYEDVANLSTLHFNDQFLKNRGLQPIYDRYVLKNLKLRVSNQRKSRDEYVKVHQAENEREMRQPNVPTGRRN